MEYNHAAALKPHRSTQPQQYRKRCNTQCAVSRESLGSPDAGKEVDEEADNVQELS